MRSTEKKYHKKDVLTAESSLRVFVCGIRALNFDLKMKILFDFKKIHYTSESFYSLSAVNFTPFIIPWLLSVRLISRMKAAWNQNCDVCCWFSVSISFALHLSSSVDNIFFLWKLFCVFGIVVHMSNFVVAFIHTIYNLNDECSTLNLGRIRFSFSYASFEMATFFLRNI